MLTSNQNCNQNSILTHWIPADDSAAEEEEGSMNSKRRGGGKRYNQVMKMMMMSRPKTLDQATDTVKKLLHESTCTKTYMQQSIPTSRAYMDARKGNTWANMFVTFYDYLKEDEISRKSQLEDSLVAQATNVLLAIGHCNDIMYNNSAPVVTTRTTTSDDYGDSESMHSDEYKLKVFKSSFNRLQRVIKTKNYTANILDMCTHEHSATLSSRIKMSILQSTGHLAR